MDTDKRARRKGRCSHPVDELPCVLAPGHPGEHSVTRRVADQSAVVRVAARLLRAGWRRDRRAESGGALRLHRDGAAVTVAVRPA